MNLFIFSLLVPYLRTFLGGTSKKNTLYKKSNAPPPPWYDDLSRWIWGSAILHFSLNYKNTQFLCTLLVHHENTGPFSSYCISQIRSTGFPVLHIPPHHHEVGEHTFYPDHLEFIDPVAPPLHSQTFSFLPKKPSSHCIPKHCTAIASVQNCTTMVCATKQLWAWLFIHML